jgi:hypothetical protein
MNLSVKRRQLSPNQFMGYESMDLSPRSIHLHGVMPTGRRNIVFFYVYALLTAYQLRLGVGIL